MSEHDTNSSAHGLGRAAGPLGEIELADATPLGSFRSGDRLELEELQRRLRAFDEPLGGLEDDSADGYWCYDHGSGNAWCSPRLLSLLGYETDRAAEIVAAVLAAVERRSTANRSQALRDHDATAVCALLRSASGEPVWLKIRAAQAHEAPRSGGQVCGSARVVTEAERRADFAGALVTSSTSRACVLDTDGYITYVNPAWKDNLRRKGEGAEAGTGVSYLEVCARSAESGDELARQALTGIEGVLSGQSDAFSLDYPCDDESERHWFQLQVTGTHGLIGRAVVRHHEITDRKTLELALEREAYSDRVTGLPNEACVRDWLYKREGGSELPELKLILYHLGVDDFEMIVHGFGRPAAEAVEVAIAARLRGLRLPDATLAALGRGDFLVVTRGEADLVAVKLLAARLRAVLTQPVSVGGFHIHVRISVGVAFQCGALVDGAIDKLLQSAEIALLRARRETGDSTRIYDDAMAQSHKRAAYGQALVRQALAGNELELHFQPIVGAVNRYPAAIETLLRRRRGDGTVHSLGDLIAQVDRSSTIIEIDRWVLEMACRQWVSWKENHGARWPFGIISVNASPFHFQQADFAPWLREKLAETGMPPGALALEVTERAYVEDQEAFARSIHDTALLGVSIWVDDFGTGYSSLEMLRQGWASVVKLDKEMAAPAHYDHSAVAVIRAVVSLARRLGIRTVAEGVETVLQSQMLDDLMCDLQQGYLHARPMSACALERWAACSAQRPLPRAASNSRPHRPGE